MTRVVAIGDTHLHGGDLWNSDRIAALDQVIASGLDVSALGAWVWPGDVFDVGCPLGYGDVVASRVQTMADAAPLVICYGNHDRPQDLDIFARVRARWPVYVVAAPQALVVPLATGETASIFVLPYPQRGGLVGAGVETGAVIGAADALLDHIFMHAADQLTTARARGDLTLMIGHANIVDAVASAGQPQIGKEISVSAAHLSRLGPILKLFSHIHKPQAIHGADYIGSICRLSFGETEEKRYLIATLQGDSSYVLESRPIACPPRYHVEGVLTRDGFTWRCTKGPGGPKDDPPLAECHACDGNGTHVVMQTITRDMAIDAGDPDLFGATIEDQERCTECGGSGSVVDWTGCDVRVRASYAHPERDVLAGARERVRQEFAAARRFEFEPVAVTDRALRAPEVISALTLDAKLRAWAKLTDVAWSEEVARCADRLQQSEDADVVAADVEARLGPLADLATKDDVRRLTVQV